MSGSLAVSGEQRCWIQIGVWGDSSCPKLAGVSHCRNCEVYSASGRRLFDRPAPLDYIGTSTALLAEDVAAEVEITTPYLVFRVGQTRFAFLATSLREITEPTVVRSVPHRARDIFRGLVNVRGELHPCISLHSLFGEDAAAPPAARPRFLVVNWEGADWVFPADEVDSITEVADKEIEPLPVTLTKLPVVYTKGLFHRVGQAVAIVDESLLCGALLRRIA